MAEIIGVIASVLTLTDALAHAVRFAVELYKAPIELIALQVNHSYGMVRSASKPCAERTRRLS